MRNRHGFKPTEADRLLETISESWNDQIGRIERHPRNLMEGHSPRQLQAIMAALVNLQLKVSYDEMISELFCQLARNSELMTTKKATEQTRKFIHRSNMMLVELLRLFIFLNTNTFRV